MAVSTDKIYEFGGWRLDPAEHLLSRNGSSVPLGPKVFDTLLLLVENAGRLVTKDEFMKRVWPDSFVEDLALTQNISQVRKILGNGDEPVIETVPKKGYRLLVPVTIRERTQSVEQAAQGSSAEAAGRRKPRCVLFGPWSARRRGARCGRIDCGEPAVSKPSCFQFCPDHERWPRKTGPHRERWAQTLFSRRRLESLRPC
jgi:DNA-binding winged helix-turn-helix (wHTH) protein